MSTNSNGVQRRASSAKARRAAQRKRKKTIFIVEVVLIVILLLVLALWMKFGRANWDESFTAMDVEVNELTDETMEIMNNYTTIALFGVDNRSNGNYSSGNSDSIMVAAINNETKEVKVISLMRDTYLAVGDDTYRKCNYAYNHGGAEEAINMINKNLDLNIQNYVAVDFYALAEVVDALGGIEVDLTQDFVDAINPETQLPAFAGYIAEVEEVTGKKSEWYPSVGHVTLDGVQTVAYCRNRYSGNNDFARAERQREVVQKIVDKIKNSNASTINKIVDGVMPDVSTSFSVSEVLKLATSANQYTIGGKAGFPFALCTGKYGSAGSLVVPCTLESNVAELHKFFYDQDDYEISAKCTQISEYIQDFTSTTTDSAEIKQEID